MNTRDTWRKWAEKGTGAGGWVCPVLVEVLSVCSSERQDYPRELCLAGRRELGEGGDTGHHALDRNGSGNHECVVQKICRGR